MSELEVGKGALPESKSGQALQVAHTLVFEDASTVPNVSPLDVTGASIELKIPKNAAILHLNPQNADLKFGKTSVMDGSPGNGFELLKDGFSRAIPCANLKSYYVQNNGVNVSLQFSFEVVDG